MNLSATRTRIRNPFRSMNKVNVRPNSVYTLIIALALIAFELFNYGTTAYALRDLLGDLRIGGLQWATLMALAFCGLDFAGIARLITQKGKNGEPKEAWYLFSAWLIAAAFNATLTWWGVSIAIANHSLTSSLVANTQNLTTIVPVIVAIMVWVIRILIIGSLTSALEHTRQSHNSISSEKAPQTTAGFPIRTQPASSHPRPQPENPSVRSIAARSERGPAYQKYMAAQRQSHTNDLMAAENRSRNS